MFFSSIVVPSTATPPAALQSQEKKQALKKIKDYLGLGHSPDSHHLLMDIVRTSEKIPSISIKPQHRNPVVHHEFHSLKTREVEFS